jgi:hypothetical protein
MIYSNIQNIFCDFLPNKITAGRPEIPPGVYKNGNFEQKKGVKKSLPMFNQTQITTMKCNRI